MPLLLARVDDRLIHGQVAYAWARALRPTLLAIVSDALAADPERADLYLCAVPEGSRGRVVAVTEALGPGFRAEVDQERTILLFAGTEEALRLVQGGFVLTGLNVGGLHHGPGKREVFPYLFLDPADRERLREVVRLGVIVEAQDLPSNPAHPAAAWLER